jgi:hypothetical protein
METQRSVFCHNWQPKQRMTQPFTTVQCNRQISDLSIHTVQLLNCYRLHNSKRTHHPQDSHNTLQYTSREPGYIRNNPDYAQKHSDNKKETSTEKERFFIINIIKWHKVTNLTRPNKFGTTTTTTVTKSTSRTQLWKWLCAPSHNMTEDNELGYTVLFKGRTQCIQDGYQ